MMIAVMVCWLDVPFNGDAVAGGDSGGGDGWSVQNMLKMFDVNIASNLFRLIKLNYI